MVISIKCDRLVAAFIYLEIYLCVVPTVVKGIMW